MNIPSSGRAVLTLRREYLNQLACILRRSHSHHSPAAHELGPTCERRVGALRGRLRHPALAREEGVQLRLALARDLAHDLLGRVLGLGLGKGLG